MATIHERIGQVIDANRDRFVSIARTIWENPELGFQEYQAMRLLTEPLAESGFEVERGLAGMETAFRATWTGSESGPTLATICEYDALNELGHACGHNLIGAAALLAGWALRQAWPDLPGRVQVIGGPAEESGGGKIILVNEGLFANVDAAMMFHPSSGKTVVHRGSLACQDVRITFHGKPSHAAAAPWKGVNALDALIQTFTAVGLLRQQLKPDARIHGIITNGGAAVNVIPELTECEFLVRATTAEYMGEIMTRLQECARAGAQATGCTVEFQHGLLYENRINNMTMARRFQQYLEAQGIEVAEPDPNAGVGSSDIGNVSRVCPTIHPYLSISAENVAGHSQEFRAAAGSPAGFEAMLAAARAMAMLAADLLMEPQLLANAKGELRAAMAQQ
ncbi:MAG: M20 family metallopeptidase [Mycobacterium leprae]